MKKCRFKPQERDDFGANPRLHRPLAPVHEVGFKVKVDETIPQWPGHREVDAPIRCRIARRNNHPAVRKPVLAQLAIKNQLVAACLSHLRCRRQLVEEQNAFSVDREEFRWHPLRAVSQDSRQAAQIDGVELNSPDVEEAALSDRAPDKSGAEHQDGDGL